MQSTQSVAQQRYSTLNIIFIAINFKFKIYSSSVTYHESGGPKTDATAILEIYICNM